MTPVLRPAGRGARRPAAGRSAWSRLAAALLILALGLGALDGARAQDDLEAQKRAELERINREAREAREAAKRLRGQEQRELVRLRRTESDLNVTRRRLRTLQNRRGQLDRDLVVTRANLERSVASLRSQREKLARRLRNLYKYGGGARELEFLLSTQSFAQLLARWDFLVMVAEQDRILLEGVQAQKAEVEENERRLAGNLQEVDRTTTRTTRENQRLASLRQQRQSQVRTIQGQRETYEAAAAELERTARAIRRLIADLEKKRREEADRARAQGRAPQPYTGNFAQGQGRLDWPVRGKVIGRYGQEKHPRWGTVTMNNGWDIEVPVGTSVRAVAKGRVEYRSEDFGAYGQMVILNHGDGYYTLYGHLSGIGVVVGQEVQAGQVIAESGESGSLKGPILHFEVRQGGASLDPADWLQ